MPKRGIAVRHDECCWPRLHIPQPMEQVSFSRGIEGSGGFIQDQEGRAPQQCTRENQPLPFSARQLASSISDAFVEQSRERANAPGEADCLQHLPKSIVVRVGSFGEQVAANGVAKDCPFLADISDARSPSLERLTRERLLVDEDRTLLRCT